MYTHTHTVNEWLSRQSKAKIPKENTGFEKFPGYYFQGIKKNQSGNSCAESTLKKRWRFYYPFIHLFTQQMFWAPLCDR